MKNSFASIKITAIIVAICLITKPAGATTPIIFETDTIVMEFGSNSKILILFEETKDLKSLQDYDINQMLKDLTLTIDSAEDDVEYLTIKDDKGDRYLRDTTIVVKSDKGKEHVRISDGARIKIGNYEVQVDDWDELDDQMDDFDIDDLSNYQKTETIEKHPLGTRHSFNIELGLNNWLENGSFPDASNAQYTVKPWGSWYIAISSTHKTSIAGPLFLDWGAHVNWFNWKFDDTRTRIIKEATEVVFSSDNTVGGIKSKLSANYINAHMVPMLDFSQGRRRVKMINSGAFKLSKYKNRGFRIGGGMYAGYRLGSSTRIVYKDNDDREKNKDHSNYFMNNFRYGVRGQMGYKGYDFFVNYDLSNVFSENRGPKLNAVSFGIIL
ncbi:MAG: hypothetical protein O2887_17005 [Bacteroidetes bacterium]|nr:hypothetical protein [Bacteroidota bacterium]MDA1122160.1 hypothetical protein [Bacteroidota bacterium]